MPASLLAMACLPSIASVPQLRAGTKGVSPSPCPRASTTSRDRHQSQTGTTVPTCGAQALERASVRTLACPGSPFATGRRTLGLRPPATAGSCSRSQGVPKGPTHPVTLHQSTGDGDGRRAVDFGVDVDLGVDVPVLPLGSPAGVGGRAEHDGPQHQARGPSPVFSSVPFGSSGITIVSVVEAETRVGVDLPGGATRLHRSQHRCKQPTPLHHWQPSRKRRRRRPDSPGLVGWATRTWPGPLARSSRNASSGISTDTPSGACRSHLAQGHPKGQLRTLPRRVGHLTNVGTGSLRRDRGPMNGGRGRSVAGGPHPRPVASAPP